MHIAQQKKKVRKKTMLKLETLKKYHEKLDAEIRSYDSIPVEKLSVCISKGNKKIGGVDNVSLPSDKTCPHCKECQLACYDKKACLQYKNVMKARARNYSILKRSPEKYFADVRNFLKKTKRPFRWHVGGDIMSENYLDNMVKTTNDNLRNVGWTYTKSQDIVNEYIRKNGGDWKKISQKLTIMFSKWGYVPIDNPYNMPVFWCIVKGQEPPKDMYHCPGDCGICLKEHRGCPYGESAWIDEH